MFEKTIEFFKKQFSNAFHAVTKSRASFIPLLLALLVVECMLFTVILSFDKNMETHKKTVEDTYDYHLTVSGISNVEHSHLIRYSARSERSEGHYIIKNTENGVLYIKLLVGNKSALTPFEKDTLESNYKDMLAELPFELEPYVSLSPLFLLEDDLDSLAFSRNLTLVFITLFLIAIFISFYSIHINNEKFKYGIYSTFGGKTRRLTLNAVCELFLCALFMVLPAYFISSLLCKALYHSRGISYYISVFRPLLWVSVLLIILVISFVSVAFSLKRISFSEPLRLIDAADNTNLVSSPFSSFNLLKRKFPLGYEVVSAWRFRKHYCSLTLTTAFLCVVYVLGVFSSVTYTTDAQIRYRTAYDYSVELNYKDASVLPDYICQEFSSIKGVSSAHKGYASTNADTFGNLLFVSGSNVKPGTGLPSDEVKDIYYMGDVLYIGATGNDTIDLLKETYTISGSPELLYEDDRNILIGSTFRNQEAFSFEVGDTVTVAVLKTDDKGVPITYSGNAVKVDNLSETELWQQQYKHFSYTFEKFTVVGVIEDYPSAANGVPIVFTHNAYPTIAKSEVVANTVYIKTDASLSFKESASLEMSLNEKAKQLAPLTYLVSVSDTFFDYQMEPFFAYENLILVLSFALLVFIPLHWFYSQLLFFKRRWSEFYALNSISASLGRIRALFICDCVIMVPIGLLSSGISLLLSMFAQWITSYVLPNFFQSGNDIVTELVLPSWLYILPLSLCFISCVCSVLLPYIFYRKEHLKAFQAEELE